MTGTTASKQQSDTGRAPAASDRRLKEDLVPIGKLPSGLQLYSWRYIGGTRRFVGLIAQDLLEDGRFADAVIADGDGFLTIDYARAGYTPADFAQMQAESQRAAAVFRIVH